MQVSQYSKLAKQGVAKDQLKQSLKGNLIEVRNNTEQKTYFIGHFATGHHDKWLILPDAIVSAHIT